ncbi:MAG: molecular chaperone HscC [Oscillospiraceae bacterium]|nr:molecular chaperone HscC [Oscillospiraceae bacterium]
MAIIGIDLGTTNSLAAYFSSDGPIIIPNVYKENLTPSVVSVDDDGNIFVGKIAKERLISHPNQTAAVFKRNMGSKKEYILGDKTFLPEELSSMIIKKLKEDAELYLGETVEEAVVSVPAYFSDAQRRNTKIAGELAGLKVERIVNEPTAAAIAYGLHEKRDYTKYLVFDLGGGTFDVSILEKYNNVMEIRAVAGDNYLGGEDFTEVLAELFIQRNDLYNLTRSESAMIYKSAENAKYAFSKSRIVTISCFLRNCLYETTVDIDEYELCCEALFRRLYDPLKRAVSDAAVNIEDIDTILLVGGATKLDIIKDFVEKLFGRNPAASINPDEVVALGAAILSAIKARNEALSEVVLTDVCPYTLGTSIAVYRPNGFYSSGHYFPIIERNSVIPISRTERLYTLNDNQATILVKILQGESRKADDNIPLGEIEISVPRAPAGKEAVDVRYTYNINGILEVEVVVVSTSEKKTLVIEKNPGVLTKDEIEQKISELASIKIHPRDKEEYRYLKARGERMYEESIGSQRQIMEKELQAFDDVLDTQDERKIRDFCVTFKEKLDQMEFERGF